jgi:hypothetical protein
MEPVRSHSWQASEPVVSSTVRDAAGNRLRRFRSLRTEPRPPRRKHSVTTTIEPFEGVRQHGPATRTTESDNPEVPPKVLHLPITNTERDKDLALTHVADIVLGAFAMRSCEYTKVRAFRTDQASEWDALCSGQRQTRPQAQNPDLTKQSMSQSYSKIRKTEEDGCPHPTAIRATNSFALRWGSAIRRIIATIPIGTSRQRYALSH